jgi:succinate dehydrogenase hydrophobic anchor subunit
VRHLRITQGERLGLREPPPHLSAPLAPAAPMEPVRPLDALQPGGLLHMQLGNVLDLKAAAAGIAKTGVGAADRAHGGGGGSGWFARLRGHSAGHGRPSARPVPLPLRVVRPSMGVEQLGVRSRLEDMASGIMVAVVVCYCVIFFPILTPSLHAAGTVAKAHSSTVSWCTAVIAPSVVVHCLVSDAYPDKRGWQLWAHVVSAVLATVMAVLGLVSMWMEAAALA